MNMHMKLLSPSCYSYGKRVAAKPCNSQHPGWSKLLTSSEIKEITNQIRDNDNCSTPNRPCKACKTCCACSHGTDLCGILHVQLNEFIADSRRCKHSQVGEQKCDEFCKRYQFQLNRPCLNAEESAQSISYLKLLSSSEVMLRPWRIATHLGVCSL